MKWPFGKKRVNGKTDPGSDPTALHNLLLDLGLVSEKDLAAAREYRLSNPEIMIGQALVQLKIIEQGVVEAVLKIQEAKRGLNSDVVDLLEYAADQTNLVGKKHEQVQEAFARFTSSLVKG